MADEEQRQKIYCMVVELHDPGLINPHEAPNANTIYHCYNDGEITNRKGGSAYTQFRNMHTSAQPIYGNLKLDISKFPIVESGVGYVIATYENCLKIRSEMEKLAELI